MAWFHEMNTELPPDKIWNCVFFLQILLVSFLFDVKSLSVHHNILHTLVDIEQWCISFAQLKMQRLLLGFVFASKACELFFSDCYSNLLCFSKDVYIYSLKKNSLTKENSMETILLDNIHNSDLIQWIV